jgi:hypothetical protein
MTEPVEGWIRRAGHRCGELGLEHLAKALAAHAHHGVDLDEDLVAAFDDFVHATHGVIGNPADHAFDQIELLAGVFPRPAQVRVAVGDGDFVFLFISSSLH